MCGRRVGKLYLPPGGRYYGCRQCHDLTYTSCQQSDKRVSRLRQDPEALDAILRGLEQANASQLMLAFKALGGNHDNLRWPTFSPSTGRQLLKRERFLRSRISLTSASV
jgi:hypothetical protein